MNLVKIKLADGSTVVVDAARHQAFQRLAHDPMFRGAMIGDGTFGNYNIGDSTDPIAFLVSQLAYTEQELFQKLYIPMQYKDLVPVSYAAGEWADTIRFEKYDWAGQGKRHSPNSNDIQMVEIAYGQDSFPVVNGAIGYDFSTEELRRTAFLRKPIDTAKQQAAMEAYERHMNNVALFGEGDDLTGLWNNADVPQDSAGNGDWDNGSTTPAEILEDLNQGINEVWTATNFNDMPTDVAIAPSALAYIASQPRSTNSDTTILKYIKENNIAKTLKNVDINFTAGYGLDTLGESGTKRVMFYVKNQNRVVMHIPLGLRFLPPQLRNLKVVIPGEYKYSGVVFRYPKSAFYMDGV